MEELKYVIEDSTIAELLGVQNFSTDEAAVLELVKNAYDANALNVILEFKDNSIKISDDGNGMDIKDIKTHWMHIGKSNKGYKIIDSNNNQRIQSGSMGVGRFALSRLGGNIQLSSKKDFCEGIVWSTNWTKSILEINDNLKNKGTCILINDLREKWNIYRIKKLNKYLEKTYKDTAMKIRIIANNYDEYVTEHFSVPKPGINCRSNIKLSYNNGELSVEVFSDEFDKDAFIYCPNIDLTYFTSKVNIVNELNNLSFMDLTELELKTFSKNLGDFSANLFFNLNATKIDKDKFLYKYLSTQEFIESGVILYRNAFSIASFEGEKDWLGLGKRSRKSPAAASHPTGAWRVRENQISGYVLIDKDKNRVLQDLMNRQGIDENIYYHLFIQIIHVGIKEFERYRQNIIRKINEKNKLNNLSEKMVSNEILSNTKNLNDLNEIDKTKLIDEIRTYKEDIKKSRLEVQQVESRFKYDVRILNSLATSGLKATSIAHEINNHRNQIEPSYDDIVLALKKYNLWDIINLPENTKIACENIPKLLENNNESVKKILKFIDAILEKVEKKQFYVEKQNINEVTNTICNKWKNEYSWLEFEINIANDLIFNISKDTFYTIFDNLILNSIQQNDKTNNLKICVDIVKGSNELLISYFDNGVGLSNKYKKNPWIILEPHETNRSNGHGLGMWIINNTIALQNRKVTNISGTDGFKFNFKIEENI